MSNGGCHPVDGCHDGDPFARPTSTSWPQCGREHTGGLCSRVSIRGLQGVKVAFVGMTLEGTPSIVTPSGVAGFEFLDEADTVNRLIPRVKHAARAMWCSCMRAASLPPTLNDGPRLRGPSQTSSKDRTGN